MGKWITQLRFPFYFFCILNYYVAYGQNKSTNLSESFEIEKYTINWAGSEICCGYSLKRSDSVAKDGKYSLRVELRKNDKLVANGKRAELRLTAEKAPRVERWYKISYFLPNDYKPDPIYDILAQWHEIPDRHLGEDWRSPPLALLTQDGKWKFRIMWATDSVNTNQTITGRKLLDLGDVETGKWTEWIFHVYFSHKDDGFLQIWKNGKQVVDEHGPNYYNDQNGPYFKVGIYKSGWTNLPKNTYVNQRVLFIDDLRVGDETYDLNKMLTNF